MLSAAGSAGLSVPPLLIEKGGSTAVSTTSVLMAVRLIAATVAVLIEKENKMAEWPEQVEVVRSRKTKQVLDVMVPSGKTFGPESSYESRTYIPEGEVSEDSDKEGLGTACTECGWPVSKLRLGEVCGPIIPVATCPDCGAKTTNPPQHIIDKIVLRKDSAPIRVGPEHLTDHRFTVSEDSVRVSRADLVYVEACLDEVARGLDHHTLTEAEAMEFAYSALSRVRAALSDAQTQGDGE